VGGGTAAAEHALVAAGFFEKPGIPSENELKTLIERNTTRYSKIL
jgi:hypothetical protein